MSESMYRPLSIPSACAPCRKGECWDCKVRVKHPGNKRVVAGTTVMCACHQGNHQWKPQDVFPRKPRTRVTSPGGGRSADPS